MTDFARFFMNLTAPASNSPDCSFFSLSQFCCRYTNAYYDDKTIMAMVMTVRCIKRCMKKIHSNINAKFSKLCDYLHR